MKYVFFDIDGTIRGKSREITKRNREAICKLRENGHKAFLCTGRAPVSITQDILDVGFDGVISAAGSFIQIDGKYIYENFLDSKRLQQAIVLFSNAQVGFTLETKDELFQSGYAREYMEEDKSKIHKPIQNLHVSLKKEIKLLNQLQNIILVKIK